MMEGVRDVSMGILGPRLQSVLSRCIRDGSTCSLGKDPVQRRYPKGQDASCFLNTIQGNSELGFSCEYDDRTQSGDSNGHEGQEVRLQPTSKEGPFNYMLSKYAKRTVPGASSPDSIEPASEEQRRSSAVMNAAEIITLLEDFDIVPQHAGRSDVKRAFSVIQHALAGVRRAQHYSHWFRTYSEHVFFPISRRPVRPTVFLVSVSPYPMDGTPIFLHAHWVSICGLGLAPHGVKAGSSANWSLCLSSVQKYQKLGYTLKPPTFSSERCVSLIVFWPMQHKLKPATTAATVAEYSPKPLNFLSRWVVSRWDKLTC
eukprot:jgi/Botrbrau1/18036/Bobra.0062s0026.1